MPKVIQVIESEICRGSGDGSEDIYRTVKQYHTFDGELIAEKDPCPKGYDPMSVASKDENLTNLTSTCMPPSGNRASIQSEDNRLQEKYSKLRNERIDNITHILAAGHPKQARKLLRKRGKHGKA